MKYLIVGLGNIGEEYAHTRHNIGFDIIAKLAKELGAVFTEERYGQVSTVKFKSHVLVLLRPNTYMNLSGKAVNYWLQKENIKPENLLVVVDDLALPFGTIRLKGKGSDGGHNGLKNINEMLGTNNYARLRFGLGNDYPQGGQIDFVLGRWTDAELETLFDRIDIAAEAIKSFVFIGLQLTMTQFNNK